MKLPVLFACALSLFPGGPLGAAESPQPRAAAGAGIGRMVPEATFTDLSGGSRQLSSLLKDSDFTVIAVTSPSCPLSQKFAPTLAALEDQWKSKGVRFVFIGAIESDPPEALGSLAKQHGWDGICTPDGKQDLLRALGAESTTEVFILDRARTLHYRGAVDDQYGIGYQKDAASRHYLEDALEAITQGQRPRLAATTAPGCALEMTPAAAPVPTTLTWHREISRVIQRNCQECHRPGGTGPFEMMKMEDVTGHAAMIKKVITKGLMPPWFAAPQTGEHVITWANDRSLSEADRGALLTWLAGERAVGDPSDAPVPLTWPQEWAMGTPDAIVELPTPVAVQPTGRMKYQYREVTTNFAEDRWVTGFEVRPTALAQVHHVLVFASAPGQRRVVDGDDFFAAYVPGSNATLYPDGYAKKLPAGARLTFQLHYTPNGTAVEDRTRLGLKFGSGAPRYEVHVSAAKQHRFSIPAGAPNHEVKGALPVPFDSQILSFMPHMHMRGKAFRYDMVDPAGQRRELLSVPAYDFNWQLQYRSAEPVLAMTGSRIEATAWYDNSPENPNNPDATKTVTWGDQTEEEMMIGYLEYVRVPADGTTAAATPLSLTPKALGLLGRRLDKDRDNRVSREEAGPTFLALHQRLDRNQDGYVTAEEVKTASGRP
jgi:thiol-disulfide isomerase/thioredoxin/mono/diheme cytochrome c family protein